MVRLTFFYILTFLLLSYSCTSEPSQSPNEIVDSDSLALIPYPLSVKAGDGFFSLNNKTYIFFGERLESEGDYLKNLITESCTFVPKVNLLTKIDVPNITLELTDMFPKHLQNGEAYTLSITPDQILIKSISTTGIMRGIQTLRQIFVPAFSGDDKRDSWYLPTLEIEDAPKFEHRGLLLDVCRHFFSKEVILKYIDALAYYKMNILHLHLTEDQGWRVEIDKYPRLNEIGSWRKDSLGNKYGGYYTKEDLKEIVAYAKERHITVIPEIELPGHSQAALASYPEYSCNNGNYKVANDWGVFSEIYCAGNDSTFLFLENVLTEIMEIFPSEYIHIGGDEAPKTRWENCKKCQNRIQEEGLSNEHELQSYFVQRIERFLNEHDRKLIGWDEILEGGLSENATVQSWRGFDGGIEAAKSKHFVVMSPTSHCYLDYNLSSIDLKKVFLFQPIPHDLPPAYHKYILGAECNMWTEHVPDEKNLDSKVFPRIIALAEVLWTDPEKSGFDNFYQRLQQHYPALKNFNIQYGLEVIGANIESEIIDSNIQIILHKNLDDLSLEYKWDDEDDYTIYKSPITLNKTGRLIVQAFKNNKIYGDTIIQKYASHYGLVKTVDYKNAYNEWYPGNKEKSLVDGKIGSIDFRDGNWQGFLGNDIEIIIDLGKIINVKSISSNFYQYANSWIFAPKEIVIQYATEQDKWKFYHKEYNKEIDLSNQKSIIHFSSNNSNEITEMRYIRFVANNIGKVPQGHEAEGSDAWLFIDEIIVR